jgi:4-amino-4-deoxy-L-arabinose transferase-like glycosyltransferase
MARYGKDVWICAGLFTVALLVRLLLAVQLPFPQLDDPAGYIQIARNIASGRGFVSDVLWNYWVSFPAVTHASNEFWMPLASVIMAGSIRLFGDTLLAAQLPGMIAGSLIALLIYVMGRTLWPDQRRWSALAALLIVINAMLVYQSVSADSAAIYTLLATLALFSGARALDRKSVGWMALAGVWCGLSYLTRSHGLLLPVSIGLIALIVLQREPKLAIKLIGALALGFVVLLIPWWLRNLNVFGTIQPSPVTLAAMARDYGEWFNYADPPSLSKLLVDGWGPLITVRLSGVWYCLGVIMLVTFPYGLLGLPVAWLRRESLFRMFAVYGSVLLLASGLIFTVPSVTGAFYHSTGPFVVWAALGIVIALRYLFARPKTRLIAVGLTMLLIALGLGQAAFAWPSAIAQSRVQGRQFAAVTRWIKANLPPGEPLITTQANTLNYSSGYPALTLPVVQDVAVVRQLADRYGVRYIVITEKSGQYPQALDQPQAQARLIEQLDGTLIYELER